ncbi:hypothetical protein [Polaromonas sp.]|uniref:hypothetical protein n=1 Tax=Polaromonas sp. TaxID=1869339 RepID=UPI003BB6ED29
MNLHTKTAALHCPNRPVSREEMHDLTDVFMGAIHQAFAGRLVDGGALAGAFIASALGVQRDSEQDNPKATIKAFIVEVDLAAIQPFTPTFSD